jgi:hypothetical protein
MNPMRRSFALSLIFALLLTLVRAPFFHLHAGRDHDHYEQGHRNLSLVFHTHITPFPKSSNRSAGNKPNISSGEHDVQVIDILLVKQSNPAFLLVQAEQLAVLCKPTCTGQSFHEPTPRTHDPPFVYSSIPRSPPT